MGQELLTAKCTYPAEQGALQAVWLKTTVHVLQPGPQYKLPDISTNLNSPSATPTTGS
jgi:hypothetical protein